jgi:hypothetical protein
VILTRATRRNIPEDTILHSHRRENLKSYEKISDWFHDVISSLVARIEKTFSCHKAIFVAVHVALIVTILHKKSTEREKRK